MRRLALCLPVRSHVASYYSASLASMCIRIGQQPMGFETVSLIGKGSSMLPHLRCQIAEEAIEKHGATHLLWIDDDHSFPDDTLHRLLAHGVPWVGINAVTRSAPIVPTARVAQGKHLYTTEQSKGLERVWSIGFGITLLEARVFQAIPKPWFMVECRDGAWWGEDATFCEKAREAGFWPMVDHDLTKETFHFGLVGFHNRDVTLPPGEPHGNR